MGKRVHGHKIDTILVLVVFCVFAMSVLIVLSLAASIYKSMSAKTNEGYEGHTCLSYIWSKVKNGNGQIYTGEFNGLSALYLEEEYDSECYVTVIYRYDGQLRELVSEKGLEFSPEDGIPVIKAGSLAFKELENGVIKAVSDSGELFLYPRVQTTLALK